MIVPSRRAIAHAISRNTVAWTCTSCRRAYSETTAQTPPLLSKLRNDLKAAMRAKDTHRLNVLKAILADVTNAGKTNNPITTDMQLLSLLRKKSTGAREASAGFKAAGRDDLVIQEETQASIMDEYASGVDVMSADDVLQAVKDLVLQLRSQEPGVRAGDVMKALFKEGGALAGKPVDKRLVPGFVKQVLGS